MIDVSPVREGGRGRFDRSTSTAVGAWKCMNDMIRGVFFLVGGGDYVF